MAMILKKKNMLSEVIEELKEECLQVARICYRVTLRP